MQFIVMSLKEARLMITSTPCRIESLTLGETQSEDELCDLDREMDPPSWQQLVSRDILQGLKPHEIKQQEVIHGKKKF